MITLEPTVSYPVDEGKGIELVVLQASEGDGGGSLRATVQLANGRPLLTRPITMADSTERDDFASDGAGLAGVTPNAITAALEALYQTVLARLADTKRHRDRRSEPVDVPWRTLIPNLADLLALPDPPIEYLVEGLIPAGQAGMVAGEPRVGKSRLVINLMRAVATGGLFLGRPCKQGSVVYLAVDDPPAMTKRRLRENLSDCAEMVHARLERWTPECLGALAAATVEIEPALIVVDTLVKTYSASGASENDSGDMDRMIERFCALVMNEKTTVLLIHHLNKIGGVRGSTAIRGGVHFVLTLLPMGGDEWQLNMGGTPAQIKCLMDWKLEPIPPFVVVPGEDAEGHVQYLNMGSVGQVTSQDMRQRIVEELARSPLGMALGDLVKMLQKREVDVREVLRVLADEHLIHSTTVKNGKAGRPGIVWKVGAAATAKTPPPGGDQPALSPDPLRGGEGPAPQGTDPWDDQGAER